MIGSVFGMIVIVIRKLPVLSGLSPQTVKEPGTLEKIKKKIKNNGTFKSFSGEILLQKALSKIRIITLKTENKTGDWLAKLRQKSIEKKNRFSEDYWQKLKRRK